MLHIMQNSVHPPLRRRKTVPFFMDMSTNYGAELYTTKPAESGTGIGKQGGSTFGGVGHQAYFGDSAASGASISESTFATVSRSFSVRRVRIWYRLSREIPYSFVTVSVSCPSTALAMNAA